MNINEYNYIFLQEAAVPKEAMATAVLETETERDRDATAVAERAKKERYDQQNRHSLMTVNGDDADDGSDRAAGASTMDKVYRGQAAYTQYIDPGDRSGQIKGAGIRAGPVRASLYARAITRWDYQPDLCKDYKETGTHKRMRRRSEPLVLLTAGIPRRLLWIRRCVQVHARPWGLQERMGAGAGLERRAGSQGCWR